MIRAPFRRSGYIEPEKLDCGIASWIHGSAGYIAPRRLYRVD
jgi:hypothetical protein